MRDGARAIMTGKEWPAVDVCLEECRGRFAGLGDPTFDGGVDISRAETRRVAWRDPCPGQASRLPQSGQLERAQGGDPLTHGEHHPEYNLRSEGLKR